MLEEDDSVHLLTIDEFELPSNDFRTFVGRRSILITERVWRIRII